MLKFKKQVWKKAKPIYGEDPNVKRRDSSGKIIEYKKYGHFYSIRGWEIDHIIPKEHCGTNELYNLQPLKCSINRQWKSKLSIDKPGMTDQLLMKQLKKLVLKKIMILNIIKENWLILDFQEIKKIGLKNVMMEIMKIGFLRSKNQLDISLFKYINKQYY